MSTLTPTMTLTTELLADVVLTFFQCSSSRTFCVVVLGSDVHFTDSIFLGGPRRSLVPQGAGKPLGVRSGQCDQIIE